VNLKYAAKDARDFLTRLPTKAASIYKPQNIHVVSLSDSQAGKAGIIAAIENLSKKVKQGDGFIFFNASHGVLLQNQYYIVTADFDGDLSKTKNLISSNEIIEMSKRIKSLSQLFIFDTCHAGGIDTIVSGLYDARMSVMAKKMGLHIYASAGSVQSAMDGYQGNGLYTHTLLQGIENGREVDKEKSGKVTVKNLGLYSKERTIEISTKLGHPQTPFIINFGRDNPLFAVQ
ncbi:MAG TPA: caspase family protein, partial [Geobacteraceae bacterium]